MSTTRIFVGDAPSPLAALKASGVLLTLDAAASNHLLRVLRYSQGDSLYLFDGLGGEYHARLEGVQGKRAQVVITEFNPVNRESPLAIHLAPVLLGGARMDLILQKAVELGVHTITPILSRWVAATIPANRLPSRLAHWQKVIINASEQCGRTAIARIQPPQPIGEWLHNSTEEVKLIAEPGGQSLAALSAQSLPTSVGILIGPEAGFTPDESAMAQAAGALPIDLGPRVLRAETAALGAVTLIQAFWGDLTAC